jgi:3-hydroxybutyryl-CoA dehydratase
MGQAQKNFKEQLRNAFDSIEIGQTYVFRRTFTDGDVSMFCGVTGDFNPYHVDELFAQESWYGRRNIPGLLTASLATHIGGMIGFIATEMSFQYLKPVYTGDTVTCTWTVVEKDAAKRLFFCSVSYVNQNGIEVLSAQIRGFPGNVRLAK